MKTREEIDKKYKLNTKEMFTSEKEFLEEIEKLAQEIKKISQYENHILDSASTLCEVLTLNEDLEKRIERVYVYAHLINDCDLANAKSNENHGKAFKIYQEYLKLSSFIVPELLESNYQVIEKHIKENETLKKYERTLKEIFRMKEHTLSKKEEYILNSFANVFNAPEDAYTKLTDVDLTFGKVKNEEGKMVELTESNYGSFTESKNRLVRKQAFKKLYKAYASIINTTSELLIANVKKNNIKAKLRNYESAMKASLDEDNIDIKVYNTLVSAVHEHFNIIYRQWEIQKKVLGVKELHLYDTYVPLVKEYHKKYTYEEGKKLICEALQVLGKEYNEILERSFKENWIDVYPNKNKRGGAYCTCCYLTHPYVVTNFNEEYASVSTIAHELGHAMHYYYAAKNNPYVDYEYSLFVAEVASQVNEILLALHVLNTSNDKEEKKFILWELIKQFKSSVVRQTMFAEFEKEIHEKEQNGEVLTCVNLCDLYYDINKKYFGNNIVVDEEIKYEWSRVPHFYYNFYVYQYATGYIAALKIASDIYNKKENALEKYLQFLSLGCTLDPVSSLKVAGVDLTDKKTFDDAFNEFNKQMDTFVNIRKISRKE